MDGFQIVKHKRGKRRNTHSKKHIQNEDTGPFILGNSKIAIEECCSEIERSSFWSCFLATLTHSIGCWSSTCDSLRHLQTCQTNVPFDTEQHIDNHDNCTENVSNSVPKIMNAYEEIVVYGIGRIGSCPIARYQFAFLLLLKKILKVTCELFDPILTGKEQEMIQGYDIQVVEENEECKRRVSRKTLFFMLHCGKPMYNNLLWANWGRNLMNICIIGNSFSSYHERLPSRLLKASASFLHEIHSYTSEHRITNSFLHEDIFNDTSIHIFPESLIHGAPDGVWLYCPEPESSTNDTEIICKKVITK